MTLQIPGDPECQPPTNEQIAAVYAKMEIRCWACGNDEWGVASIEEKAAVSYDFVGMTEAKKNAYHLPSFNMVCTKCATVWRVSTKRFYQLLREVQGDDKV